MEGGFESFYKPYLIHWYNFIQLLSPSVQAIYVNPVLQLKGLGLCFASVNI